MFQRKKTSDVQSSLQRFSDMHRDSTSRAKHFRLAMEALSPQDKRQLVDDFSFEAFHLIDSLLLHPDLSVDAQVVFDAESALWTLEQVLCFAPELVGKGWQRNAIECILKRALLPRNLLGVRKIAIRLFLIWYQCLAIYNGTNRILDVVFQCCLPYFPLKNSQRSERILQEYCESPTVGFAPPLVSTTNNNGYGAAVAGFDPAGLRITPIIVNGSSVAVPTTTTSSSTSPVINEQASVRERAQTLQIYLDKFLDYCSRETMKIEWADESRRVDCAKFLLDRVIVLYVYEVFPDIETDGVDVFGGWEGDEEHAQVLDTADPQVIARYWLIRWMINIASAGFHEQPSSGLLLYRQVLLSSQKATNNLLTLMREAMQLPLACSNVIHKVLALIRYWLLQKEIPVFVESGLITLEAWNLLLIHIYTSFFNSPYLVSSGDRLPSAISLTHSILQMSRDLANPSVSVLPRQLPKTVWAELLKRLSQAFIVCCARSDAYGSATAGGFTRTLLSVCVFVRVIREVELDERMWDDVWQVFKAGIWTQMVEQWSKVVENVTRALILNLFAIDVSNLIDTEGSTGHAETSSTGSASRKLTSRTDKSSENGSVGNGHYLMDGEEDVNPEMYGERNSEKEMQGVVQSTGNATCWLRSWMRLLCLMDPTQPSRSQATVQTFSRTIELLLRVGCANTLIHWVSQRLLRLQISQQPHAVVAWHLRVSANYSIAPLCSVLTKAQPPELVRAHILYHLLNCLRSEAAPLVLEQIPQMGIEDIGVLSPITLTSLQKMVSQGELSSKVVRVAALLCLSNPEAEKILLGLLDNSEADLDVDCLLWTVNALCILVLERADAQLFDTLLKLLCGQKKMAAKLIPILCSNLGFVGRLGMESRLANAMIEGLNRLGEDNVRLLNDLKWQLCALKEKGNWIKPLVEKLDKDGFLEGLLVQLHSQFPLPGFSVDQWNSLLPGADGLAHKDCSSSVFVDMEGALMSFDKTENNNYLWTRSMVGRHCYASGTGLQVQEEKEAPVNTWLKSLCSNVRQQSSVGSDQSQKDDHLSDPFKQLPRPTVSSYSGTDVANHSPVSTSLSNLEMSDFLHFIENSHREPEPISEQKWKDEMQESAGMDIAASAKNNPCSSTWRQFATDFRLLEKTSKVPTSFHRDLKHLDSTLCREVHKVAVIYVAKDQEDKHSILSNTSASALFNKFVDGLGWTVQIGSPKFQGYCGGLPAGQTAPYYASANTELIFHISTMLTGDATQKLKHLGNDEVHVVWSENPKCYRRELIATRFCDILIVLYPASANLVRVQVETQDSSLQFGPLFDGACVHIKQIASLTRETVLNASRAYRNARVECDRPNKHREKVFSQTKELLSHMPLKEAIVRLYAPMLNS